MRIIGGKFKGRKLRSVRGTRTRPTSDRTREAIFNIIAFQLQDVRVLDLFAGTGALGIEALSRGAERVDFVDCRKSCCDLIRANLEKIGELEWAHIYCCSASKAITFLDKSYDVIFIDPPYSNPTTNDLLVKLAKSKLLGEDSIIVVCHANRFPLDTDYNGLHLIEKRRYGDTFISIYRKEV